MNYICNDDMETREHKGRSIANNMKCIEWKISESVETALYCGLINHKLNAFS